MAVENYDPIVLQQGQCLDQNWFEPAYQSLSGLNQAAKDGASTFECVHLSGNVSGNTTSGESCVQAISPSDMPKEYLNGDQICCLILSFSGSMGSVGTEFFSNIGGNPILPNYTALIHAFYTSQEITATIKCAGQTISTHNVRGNGVISAILDPTICEFSQGIEICIKAQTAYNLDFQYTVNWCGCMICAQCPPLPLDDFYVPIKPPNPNCEYGLGDLSLVIHALNQLNGSFRSAGYSVECITREQITESELIADNLDTDTKWVGIVCTRALWTGLPIGSKVYVESSMGCSQRPVLCNSGAHYSRGINTAGVIYSAEFAGIACGECKKGESIWFGSSPQYECAQVNMDADDADQQPTDVEVGGISDMIFWVFKKVENDLPNLPQLKSGCVFSDTAEAITDGAEAINQAACNIKKINKRPEPFSNWIVVNTDYEIVEPYIDPNSPVPAEPIPNKKWAVYGSMCALAIVASSPGNFSLGGNFSYQIKCGGTVVHQSPIYPWLTVFEGIRAIKSERVTICAVIDCPEDQPIEICFSANLNGLNAVYTVRFEGTAICIS